MAEKFSNLNKKTDILIQEAQRVINKMKPQIFTRHIVIKMAKLNINRHFWKAARGKQPVTYKETTIMLSADSSAVPL